MYDHYLESAKKQFNQYKTLGEKAMLQVPEEKLFWQFNPESNSIGSIVKHLSGNMLSRFTDFLTTDGESHGVTGTPNLKMILNQRMNYSANGTKAGNVYPGPWRL
jgi:hypothetical protein